MKTKNIGIIASLLKTGLRLCALPLVLLLCQALLADVTFTVTPSAISNTYAGNITLQISGLTNGESVRIGKCLDANTNGVVDAGDLLVQGFRLTDGQAAVIGGVTNLNYPGDLDSNGTNGAITSVWSFPASGIAQRMTGQYVYRFVSPTGRFPTTNVLFNVTNPPYAQSISGTVLNGISPVPNAGVLLFPGSGMHSGPAAGAVADDSGNYSIKVAPGTYMLWAFKSNYLADVSAAAVVTLGTGASLSTNLYLLQATQSISGQFTYAGTNIGLVGLLVVCQSTSGLLALGFTDTNGNFNVPVNASQWEVSTDDQGLAAYFSYSLQNRPSVDTTTGSVANVTLTFRRGTALFYGTVKDDQNQPLVGLSGYADDDGDLYEGVGTTDQNGYFIIGVGAGNWQIGASEDNPVFADYIFPQQNGYISITDGEAIQLNVVAILATNHITGNVQISGTNIVGVGVNANGTINGTNYHIYVATDAKGNYSMNVANGTWNISVHCGGDDSDSLDNILGSGNYQCPDDQTAIINNNDATNNFTVQPCSGISIVTSSPLPIGEVNVPYYQSLQASSCSNSFTWSFISGTPPPGLTGNPSTGEIYGMPTNAGTFTFTVQVTDGANTTNKQFSISISNAVQITTISLPNGTNYLNYSQQLQAADGVPFGGASPYSWTLASDSDSLPPNLALDANGLLSGMLAASGTFDFTVEVADSLNGIYDQLLEFTIVSSTNSPLTTLYSFSSGDGSSPNGLVQGSDGNFYGTTEYGGAYTNQYREGLGTVFKLTPPGILTTLYSFSDIDGANPATGLMQGADGNFYGTTEYGGEYIDRWGDTFGTVFKITTNGMFTSLYSFSGSDGANPVAGLVQGRDGNFYGTTSAGGVDYYLDDGTVFKITANGSFTSLASFSGRDGIDPEGGLVQGADGNFYGTTTDGGRYLWNGTVFRMATNGTLSTLYSFTGGGDGASPAAGLVQQGADGNFYGTTFGGGTNNSGTVFKIMTNGAFTSLYSFGGIYGENPAAGLVPAAAGNFYGTTEYGGANGSGTVFKITPDGVLTLVYSFTGGDDGAYPNSALVQGKDGNFYGTTASGGAHGNGAIFRLSLVSPPAPEFLSVTKVGEMIALTWSATAGQTYQLQFKTNLNQMSWNDSGSAITATNSTVTAWDSIGPDPQRFYRVKIGP